MGQQSPLAGGGAHGAQPSPFQEQSVRQSIAAASGPSEVLWRMTGGAQSCHDLNESLWGVTRPSVSTHEARPDAAGPAQPAQTLMVRKMVKPDSAVLTSTPGH